MAKLNEEESGDQEKRKVQGPSIIKPVLKLVGGLLLACGALGSCYTVKQDEHAVITRFGQPIRVVVNLQDRDASKIDSLREKYGKENISLVEGAGLHFKIPFVDSAEKLDRRFLRWQGFTGQVVTRDKKYIVADPAAYWRIDDPLLFYRSVKTEDIAQTRLDDRIDSITGNSIRTRDLIELVRTDNTPMKFVEAQQKTADTELKVGEGRQKIIDEIANLSSRAVWEYGIALPHEGFLFKGVSYVDEVKTSVEDRMIKERSQMAAKYLSEGDGEAKKIIGGMERDILRIKSEAYRESQQIKGDADAQATKIYASGFKKDQQTYLGFNSDPELYRFTRMLELWEAIPDGKLQMVVGMDNPLFSAFKGDVRSRSQYLPTTRPTTQPTQMQVESK